MHPILFEFLGQKVYGYGLMIGIGIAAALYYEATTAKREIGLSYDQSNNLLIYMVIAAIVGGKIFLLLEEPRRYLSDPLLLVSGAGFVFYGSLLFCYMALYWFIKKNRIPARTFLDIMAITTLILHVFGRIGCFLAGCCYGKPTGSNFGVMFSDPLSSAQPLNCYLHPVQLYEAAAMSLALLVLVMVKRYKRFEGQVFALYLILYPLIRFNIEYFRGDVERGFLFNGMLSNAQAVSIPLLLVGIFLYVKWRRN